MKSKPQSYEISMSRRFRNILDFFNYSESDHESQSKQGKPTGTVLDRLNALFGCRSSQEGKENRTTLESSPCTSSSSPPSEDNYDNVNDISSGAEKSMLGFIAIAIFIRYYCQ